MRYIELVTAPYSLEDMTTFEFVENFNGWNINQSKAYKSGFKKYRNVRDIMKNHDRLLDFIKSYNPNNPPAMKDYPAEFYVHMLHHHDSKPFWAHLWGTRFGLVWKVVPGNINLMCLGTHNDCGVGNF